MIGFREFSKIFKDSDFTPEEIGKFYRSVKKSVILQHIGKQVWPEIFKLEEKCQWPLLQRIDNPELPIYCGADKPLLSKFIKTIEAEKSLREQKMGMKRADYWVALQSVIEERIELFESIFGFCKRDVRYCETVAERYRRILDLKVKNRKKLWQVGIGAGAATLGGAAALWYISKKGTKG